MSPDLFPKTWKVLQRGIRDEVAPGFVVGLWEKRQPNEIGLAAVGHRRLLPTPLEMHATTVFDIASVSKVLATTTLCAVMVDQGQLHWDTPVKKIFPKYPYTQIQVKHLLSHTAGLASWKPFWQALWKHFEPQPIWKVPVADRQQVMRKLVFDVAPDAEVGIQAVYSDLSFLILGFILEEITHTPFDQAVEHFVFKPMGLQYSHFHHVTTETTQDRDEKIAATENCPHRGGVLQGQVHDDNCWAMGGYAGHAGVFSNARDLLHFSRSLMCEQFLSPSSLQTIWTRISKPSGATRTLGWDTPSGDGKSSAGKYFSPHSVGHLGFTGTSLWIDVDAELSAVLLSNRVHSNSGQGRENIKIRDFRPQFHDALREDLRKNL